MMADTDTMAADAPVADVETQAADEATPDDGQVAVPAEDAGQTANATGDESVPSEKDEAEDKQPGDEDVPSGEQTEISEELKTRAAKYDLDEADLANFGDHAEQVVDRIAYLQDKQLADFGKSQVEPEAEATGEEKPPEAAPEVEPPADIAAQLGKMAEEGGYDDVLVGVLTDLAKQLQVQNANLDQFEGQLAGFQQLATKAQEAEVVAQKAADSAAFDKWINGLPESHREVLKDSKVQEEHQALVSQLDAGHFAKTGERLPMDELSERAFRIAAFPQLTEMARQGILDQAKKQSEQRLAAPATRSRRGDAQPTTKEQAIADVTRVLRDAGYVQGRDSLLSDIDKIAEAKRQQERT